MTKESIYYIYKNLLQQNKYWFDINIDCFMIFLGSNYDMSEFFKINRFTFINGNGYGRHFHIQAEETTFKNDPCMYVCMAPKIWVSLGLNTYQKHGNFSPIEA